jgi:predicted glutamine amidotransferase
MEARTNMRTKSEGKMKAKPDARKRRIATLTLTFVLLLGVCVFAQGNSVACELLGLSFNERVPARHVLSAFRHGGIENPDGWGVAFYSDNSVTLFKEAANAMESPLAEFLTRYEPLNGRLLIGHVRSATVGGQTHKNSHPFRRELGGKEYTLAHNGTLEEFKDKLKLGRFKPVGTTDSEHLLCYLLRRIEENGVGHWDANSFEWLKKELLTINATGSLNCVFSDGEHLFAYHDKDGYNTLYHLNRIPPHKAVCYPDLPEDVELGSVYSDSAAGVIVATRPLTDEQWTEFVPGEFLVYKEGIQVFPSTPTAVE